MNIPWRKHREVRTDRRAFLEIDMVVGLAILVLAVAPLGYAFTRERQALQNEYRRVLVNELVDGELEILAAGAARGLSDGTQAHAISSEAVNRLPEGHFQLTKAGTKLRLEWLPAAKCGVGPVMRECLLP